jgi:cephalosporin-C deacetylase
MKNTDPQIELIESEFKFPGLECFDLYFTGVRNARIHAKFVKPANLTAPAPAMIMFHGYTGCAPDWMGVIPYAAAGFVVAFMDCRGQGGKSEDTGGHKFNTFHGQIIRGLDNDTPDDLLFRHIMLDTAELTNIIMDMPDVDRTRVGVTGGSQGGGLTLACASLVPEVNRIVPIYPFLSDYLRVWEMDLAANAYAELKDYFRRFDPRHERHDEIFTRLGYIDVHNLASRIKAKTLMFTGMMDTTCPPSTQFAAYNAITAEKDYILYPDYAHEGLPGAGDITFKFMAEML